MEEHWDYVAFSDQLNNTLKKGRNTQSSNFVENTFGIHACNLNLAARALLTAVDCRYHHGQSVSACPHTAHLLA